MPVVVPVEDREPLSSWWQVPIAGYVEPVIPAATFDALALLRRDAVRRTAEIMRATGARTDEIAQATQVAA